MLRHIVTLSHLYGDGSPGTIIPLTQETLAGLPGTTRPTTNQVLRRAGEAGLISLDRGRVKIENPGAVGP